VPQRHPAIVAKPGSFSIRPPMSLRKNHGKNGFMINFFMRNNPCNPTHEMPQ
jgi:hypothetical protein